MIKVIWGLRRNRDLSLAEFSQHWFEVHGQHHVSEGHKLDGYVQHHSLVAAYDGPIKPTLDGASIIRLRDIAHYREAMATDAWLKAARDSRGQVRGRLPLLEFPWCFSVAHETVVHDGPSHVLMVKIITMVQRNPAVALDRFYRLWRDGVAARAAAVPGMRRYVQNHALPEARELGPVFYDGWDEMWFDNLEALYAAAATPEGVAYRSGTGLAAKGIALFDLNQNAIVIGRERDMLTRK